MFTIDENTLAAHGIRIPEDDKETFMQHLQAQVEEQVGLAVIEKLNDEDAKQLLELTNGASQDEASVWLQQHMPNYEQVVQQEVDTILNDVAASQAE